MSTIDAIKRSNTIGRSRIAVAGLVCPSNAGNRAVLGLANPAANARHIVLTRFDVKVSNTDTLLFIVYPEASFPAVGTSQAGTPNFFTAYTPLSALRSNNALGAGVPAGGTQIANDYLLSAATISEFIKSGSSLVIPPGYGLFVVSTATGINYSILAEWLEY